MNGTLPRRIAALGVLIVAGLASLATSPGPVPTKGVLEVSATLTPSDPIAAFPVNVVISANGGSVDQPALQAWGDEYYGGSTGYSLSIIPSDSSESMRPVASNPFGFLPTVSQDLARYCTEGCSRSYIIVMRSDSIFDVAAVAHIYASAYSRNGSSSPTATVTLSEQQFPDGVRALSSKVSGELDADFFGSGSWRGTIHIPAAAYDALSGPVYGSIVVSGDPKVEGDYAAGDVRLSINGASENAYRVGGTDHFYFERGWLSACTAGGDCAVPVQIDLLWSPFNLWGIVPFVPGHVHLSYQIEARLEYLNRADLPLGATLELVAR